MRKAIEELGEDEVKKKVEEYAEEIGVPANLHIDYICNTCCKYPKLAPNMNKRRKHLLSSDDCIKGWVNRFKNGFERRISIRVSNKPETFPDRAINTILSTGLNYHCPNTIKLIIYAHRLAMSAENILGLLLEEYLFRKLSPLGWAMAWGETIKSVDFCSADGALLQVKNRSNSENSSSSRVRSRTTIKKWFRVNATNGHYEWDSLKNLIGAPSDLDLSEDSFQRFIKDVLQRNTDALAIEDDNPWLPIFACQQELSELFKS